jgi:protein-S-isoprenylcysteine O-methyltransferase Ste14
MNDTIFRILAAVIFVIGAVISSYHRSKAERESAEKLSLKEEGRLMTAALRMSGLALWIAVFAFLIYPPWMAWSRLDLPEWARWLGVGMGAAGDALAYWTFRNLGSNVSPTVVTRKNHSLVTSGPYRWVRHPLYLMGLIGYTGFALLAENWFIALMAVLTFTLINLRLPKEEARLIERFGSEYRDYMRRTGKFLPKFIR